MPNFTLTEGSGKFNSLYGKFEAPIVSCIEDAAEAYEQLSVAPKIFRVRKSNNFADGYTSTTAMDDWQPVGENGERPQTGFEEGYTKILPNEVWKSGFSISRELVDDNQIGQMLDRAKKFTRSYYRTQERFFARILGYALQRKTAMTINNRKFDLTGADGECVFSKNHKPKVSGAKQTNVFADAFSEDALFRAMTAMQNLKGDNNETLALVPDTLIIPNVPELKKQAMAILASYQKPGSANNDYNPLFGNFDLIVWPYLNDFIGTTNTAPWIIMDSKYNEECDCAVWQNRVDMEVSNKEGDHDEQKWNGYSRFTGGFVDFRALMAGGITGGSDL